MRFVHHEVHEERNENGHDVRAVLYLIPVDAAFPCRRSVDNLVAQDVEAVEQDVESFPGLPPLASASWAASLSLLNELPQCAEPELFRECQNSA